MECYIVGGAVRDRLLQRPLKDRDWVVVGASPQEMMALGYKSVGKNFPVFLHPETHEEYALARTERKTGKGYHGFDVYAAPDVTLEQDLARRDLTINAIAETEDGTLIDPYNGQRDLQEGILRHVSSAFAEDPVRILRLARFSARFGFSVSDDTMALMSSMVKNGEADALVKERVWQELAKGLMEERPSRMFCVLRACGALSRVVPELDAVFSMPRAARQNSCEVDTDEHVMRALDYAAEQGLPLTARFATLVHDLGKIQTPGSFMSTHPCQVARGKNALLTLCKRLRVPADCRDLALITVLYQTKIHHPFRLNPNSILKLFKQADALRRPGRFLKMLGACYAHARGHLISQGRQNRQPEYLSALLDAALAVDAGGIASQWKDKPTLPKAIDDARVKAIANRTAHLQHTDIIST